MEECVDGEYQNFKAKGGAYTRENFFGKYPELKEMVANMSDEDIWRLNRGGHDARKVFAAYAAAQNHKGQPTVILAKTVKGFGLGKAAEGQMVAHQQKKLDEEALRAIRDRFNIPLSDEQVGKLALVKPADDIAGNEVPARPAQERSVAIYRRARSMRRRCGFRSCRASARCWKASGDREISTTMAFVRILTQLLKDKNIGKNVVPIVPDEARTFGMEGLFRQIGIYSSAGQLYSPRGFRPAHVLQGETSRVRCSKRASTRRVPPARGSRPARPTRTTASHMIPFYIYYSMFGFQRVGDFYWAAGDLRTRGFLLGATAGRTTLAGEGLQHQDGHSLLHAATVPNCVAYDPTYAYELAVIIHDGLQAHVSPNDESVFYYIAVMNENYVQPALPKGVEEGILKGMYLLQDGRRRQVARHPLGSGTILREVDRRRPRSSRRISTFLPTSTPRPASRAAPRGPRDRTLEPPASGRAARTPYVKQALSKATGPFIAATDYMRAWPDMIREWVPGRFVTLGTDGFGRSDGRTRAAQALRSGREEHRRTPRCARWPMKAPSTRAR